MSATRVGPSARPARSIRQPRPGGRGVRESVGRRGESGGLSPQVRVAEIQRARVLAAAVGAIDEFGYGDATVARITERARVSRRTFYEMFANSEECLVAVLETALARIGKEITTELDGLSWRERVRRGLGIILSFFDREPTLARVCVVQSLRGSEAVLQRRAEVLARLVAVVDEGRREGSRTPEAPSLTAEGLVGAAHAIVYERLLKRSNESLIDLLGPLMSMIALPYMGTSAAKRELTRRTPAGPTDDAGEHTHAALATGRDPLEGVAMRLTYRTARVLECIAQRPGISNRVVGDEAGIADQGQASKLLARLERLGLARNSGNGHAKGEANAWHLTPQGAQVAQIICTHGSAHEKPVR